MGSKTEPQKTAEIESMVPSELYSEVLDVRTALNALEDRLAKDFPELWEQGALAQVGSQEALYAYCRRLTRCDLRKRILDLGGLVEIKNPFAELFPNFVKYLEKFGSVGFSPILKYRGGKERAGVFLTGKSGNDELIGMLEMESGQRRSEYVGFVPITVSEKEFHGCSIKDISEKRPDIGNSAFVRLLWETSDSGFVREDGYESKGIPFP